MARSLQLIKAIPPGFLFIGLMAVYSATLAPGLSWANYGADGGDLITAAATGGIAHPTGYPLYLLLARLFQFIPIGSLAFRTNLLSAIATALAAVLVYSLVARTLNPSNPQRSWLPGLVSGIAFGLAPLVWSQAVISEVYGLHSLIVVLLLYLSINYASLRIPQRRIDCLLGLSFGLGMGNHITTLLLLPIILFNQLFHRRIPTQGKRWKDNWQFDIRSLLRRLSWVGIGLLVYIILPLRAMSKPVINWGNPATIKGFIWLVSGELYQAQFFILSLSSVWERVKVIAGLLIEQFGIPGLGVGLAGLILFAKSKSLNLSMLWISVASTFIALVYATTDAFFYLIPGFLCFAIWIGLGLGGIMDICSRRVRWIGVALGAAFLLAMIIPASIHWPQVDASQDQRAEDFTDDILTLSPPGAIVFAEGDAAVFTLWYAHFALHERPDLTILATDMLQFDWYQFMVRSSYPSLTLPGPFPFSETVVMANPARPVCYVKYIQMTEITCLPARISAPP